MILKSNYIVFGQPMIEEEEIKAVVNTLNSKWIGTGPKVAEFETEFRNYIGTKYSAAVSSCTAALHLVLKALDLPVGSKVITSTMTFAATANAIIHAGYIPVFCDVDPVTRNMTPATIEKVLTPDVKAILPVHFSGYPCDMDGIMRFAEKNNLLVVEDCAHAIETKINGKHTGTLGIAGCFSFYVTKNIMTGEGGMIVTNNPDIQEKVKILSLHGLTKDAWKRFSDEGYKHYQVIYSGFKYNMTDIQAALGLAQIQKIETFRKRRKEIWKIYQEEFRSLPCKLPPDDNDDQAYHLFCIEIMEEILKKSRDQVLQEYHQLNIGTGVHYLALHLQPLFKNIYKYKEGDFPCAEKISATTISLPFSPSLSDSNVEKVVSATKQIMRVK